MLFSVTASMISTQARPRDRPLGRLGPLNWEAAGTTALIACLKGRAPGPLGQEAPSKLPRIHLMTLSVGAMLSSLEQFRHVRNYTKTRYM